MEPFEKHLRDEEMAGVDLNREKLVFQRKSYEGKRTERELECA